MKPLNFEGVSFTALLLILCKTKQNGLSLILIWTLNSQTRRMFHSSYKLDRQRIQKTRSPLDVWLEMDTHTHEHMCWYGYTYTQAYVHTCTQVHIKKRPLQQWAEKTAKRPREAPPSLLRNIWDWIFFLNNFGLSSSCEQNQNRSTKICRSKTSTNKLKQDSFL